VNDLTDLYDEDIMWHIISVSGSVNRQDPVATGPALACGLWRTLRKELAECHPICYSLVLLF